MFSRIEVNGDEELSLEELTEASRGPGAPGSGDTEPGPFSHGAQAPEPGGRQKGEGAGGRETEAAALPTARLLLYWGGGACGSWGRHCTTKH